MLSISKRNETEIKKIEDSLLKITYPICKFGQSHFQENATQICLDERCPSNIRFELICNSCTSKRGEHFKEQHKHANLGAIAQDIIDQIKQVILPEQTKEHNQESKEANEQQSEVTVAQQNEKNEKNNKSMTKMLEEQVNQWIEMSEICREVARKIHISSENYIQSKYATVPTEYLQILSCISNLTKESTVDNINQQFRELQRYTKTQEPQSSRDQITLKVEDSASKQILEQIEKSAQEKLTNSQSILTELRKKLEDLASQPEVQSYQQIKYQEYYQENARALAEKCLHIKSFDDVQQIQPTHELIVIKSLEQEIVDSLKKINLANRLIDIEMPQDTQTSNCKKIIELLISDNSPFQNIAGINLILPQKNLRDLDNTNDSSNELIISLLKPLQKIIQLNKFKDFGLNFKNWSKCTNKTANALSDTIKALCASSQNLISFSLNLQSLIHLGGDQFTNFIESLKIFSQKSSRIQNFSFNISRLINLNQSEFKGILESIEQIALNNQNIHHFELNLSLIQNIHEDAYKQIGEILQILATKNKTITTLKLSFMGWSNISDKNALIILENLEQLVMSNNLFKCFTFDIQNWELCTDVCIQKVENMIKTLTSFCKTLEEFSLNMSYWKLGKQKAATDLANTLVKLAKGSPKIYKFNLDFFNWSDECVEIFEQLQQDLQIYFNSVNDYHK
ncbi:hypothetical protein TTHERM_00266420 (macronuclear) [Tetrahymena thermophila SB210]|uniref:Uncharacterized protein n=1 Tax=Tetrahymena thermophila (strain SB210) TaxID=312017 RepID=I7MIX6_TETTS|nr:hypothetical protein TTHERM_00266420 [Tetrahymena thermophila SB210]EAR95632.1 hypothetical protein TTHERM_00266420 [Tetrahymena thermophila SB210]|eukprot:XP_001015877.1 hypothetical protein TTHERM_00266420 [Tetrahymena thermophila SB210]